MSEQYYQASIDDVQNNGCSEVEVEPLIDIFIRATKKTACTLARKAWFDLSDFRTAKIKGVTDFTLTLEKYNNKEAHTNIAEQWIGTFECDGRSLIIFCSLFKDYP